MRQIVPGNIVKAARRGVRRIVPGQVVPKVLDYQFAVVVWDAVFTFRARDEVW